MDLAAVGVQVGIALVPLGAAFFAYRASTDANKKTVESARITAERQAEMEHKKVDSEAFERAKTIYDSGIQLLERQLILVQSKFEQLNEAATEERGTFMHRIHLLQKQIEALESTVVMLRRQLIEAGISPAPHAVGPPDAQPAAES